jgi:hypothetical protein
VDKTLKNAVSRGRPEAACERASTKTDVQFTTFMPARADVQRSAMVTLAAKVPISGARRRSAAAAKSVRARDSGRADKPEGRASGRRRPAGADAVTGYVNRCCVRGDGTTARWRATERDSACGRHLRLRLTGNDGAFRTFAIGQRELRQSC